MGDPLRAELQASLGAAYVLGRELGGGGMSRVFVARDETLNRDVVVKVLAPELAEGISIERFSREIRMAAALQEPHIVPVLTAGSTSGGLPYYTMPFVEGESLRARMGRGSIARSEAVSVLRDVARALGYAHARHIVHRDIKPENILLSSGTAVVTDFGIAKALQLSRTLDADGPGSSALTRTGTSLGTPAYMAPEQAAGDPATDHRADVYAWGVVAYELLAGRHPFADKLSPQQLLAAHMGETPASLATTQSRPSPAVADLVMRCLAKDPAQRPASAAELVGVLDGLDGSAGVTPPSVARRVRIAAIAGALAVVSMTVWATTRDSVGELADVRSSQPIMMAVLPFEHDGPADQQPFTNGLTDAVTSKLGALRSLAVIDRRSAATYRGSTKPTRQIGTELGVRYLLEGVVRWQRDGAGVWRARVTPTLIDAVAGTTKWTGEPVEVTLDDPFTAQGAIAADVAKAMEVALLPAERAALARKMSDNPQAFAAFQRGVILLDPVLDVNAVKGRNLDRASAEFDQAVALDSTFREAWGLLVVARAMKALNAPGDTAAESLFRSALVNAQRHAPEHPLVLLELAFLRHDLDHDTVGVDGLVRRALEGAPNDAFVLMISVQLVEAFHGRDTAFVLARRAAALDPRSRAVQSHAAWYARALRRWDLAAGYSDAIIALDSTSEMGWLSRMLIPLQRGDTLEAQRIFDKASRLIPRPSQELLVEVANAGNRYGRRFAAISARELGVTSLRDSAMQYYDTKQDIHLRLGDPVMARVYSDSIVRLVSGRSLSGFGEMELLSALAFAQANLGRAADARRTLGRAITVGGTFGVGGASAWMQPTMIAGTYARLGEPDAAVRWLEDSYTRHPWGWTAQAYAISPKLLTLRGTPAFEKFLRAHPD